MTDPSDRADFDRDPPVTGYGLPTPRHDKFIASIPPITQPERPMSDRPTPDELVTEVERDDGTPTDLMDNLGRWDYVIAHRNDFPAKFSQDAPDHLRPNPSSAWAQGYEQARREILFGVSGE